MSTRTLWPLLLVGAAVLAAPACNKKQQLPAETTAVALQIPTVVVVVSSGPAYIELTGTLSGVQSVALSTKLMSEITELSVEEGQRVKAGQVLARIDDKDIVALRSEAAAYRAEATAALQEVEAASTQAKAGVAQAEAAIKQAQAAYDDAKRDFERAERLAAEESIPRAQRDKAELGMKVAEENLHRAEAGKAQAEGAVAQAKSKGPQIAAKQQQADAKDAQAAAMQDYATLKAPFDGVVVKKNFEQGQLALPGQPILMLEDTSSYRVIFNVPDNIAPTLMLGQALTVTLDGSQGQQAELPGNLAVLSAAADPASHTVRAELALDKAEGLFSGRFARVRLPSGEKSVLLIPHTAVVREGELAFVWRASPEGVLSQVPVELGPVSGAQVEIVRGLSVGDRIVSQPTAELYSGARVVGSQAAGEQAHE